MEKNKLSLINNLSARALNIYLDFDSEDEFINYYLLNNNFNNIRNIGSKTNRELVEYSINLINRYSNHDNLNQINLDISAIDDSYILKLIYEFVNSVKVKSIRSYNVIIDLLKNNCPNSTAIEYRFFFEKFIANNFDFKSLPKIGVKSLGEIENSILYIRRRTFQFYIISSDQLNNNNKFNKLMLKKYLEIYSDKYQNVILNNPLKNFYLILIS